MADYELVVEQINANVPSVPNDDYYNLANTTGYLYSIYQGQSFSIDLRMSLFSIEPPTPPPPPDPESPPPPPPPPPTPTPVPITHVQSSFTTYHSVSFSTVDYDPYAYTVRVSGNVYDAMPGEAYTLLMNDRSIITSPIINPPPYLAIVRWTLPSSFAALMDKYTFNINSGTYVLSANQYIYWDAYTNVQRFKVDLAKGI